MSRRVVALWLLALACALPRPLHTESAIFEMERANAGSQQYSAWFADSDGRVLYFGLSSFWQSHWAAGGDPTADLAEPGDHLIGRFALARERFLPPLRVRAAGPESASSVWDVLAHSNGRIYYTTYFEEIGSVAADGGDMRVFTGIGAGFNELYEGPGGRLWVTRYSSTPGSPSPDGYGGVVVLTPEGELVEEFVFPAEAGRFTAPKSVAVDPASGEIWLNTDTFEPDGRISHETIRLASDGTILERRGGDPELHFVRFDAAGRGWFVESSGAQLQVRVVAGERTFGPLALGPHLATDFAQDIHFAANGAAVVARWSGIVHVVRESGGVLEQTELRVDGPRECAATGGPALLYSAVLFERAVYGTLHCRAAIVRLPLQH